MQSIEPSPLIGYSVVNLLYAYIITTRYYVGEHHSNACEAVELLSELCAALSKGAVFQNLDATIASVEEKAHDVSIFLKLKDSGFQSNIFFEDFKLLNLT